MIYTSDIADAIVNFLQSCDLGEDVTIARKRLVLSDLEGMTGTSVAVIPWGSRRSQNAEGVQEINPDVRIVVQRKLTGGDGSADTLEADAVGKLSENIAALMVGRIFFGYECQSANLMPSYDPAQIAALNVFDATIHTLWSTFEDGPDD
jgi:hypothetical protein